MKTPPFPFWKSPLRWLLVFGIRAYQSTAARRIPVCRYTPTCSEYVAQALLQYGVWKGLALGIRRILRCNPFSSGGHDPVP